MAAKLASSGEVLPPSWLSAASVSRRREVAAVIFCVASAIWPAKVIGAGADCGCDSDLDAAAISALKSVGLPDASSAWPWLAAVPGAGVPVRGQSTTGAGAAVDRLIGDRLQRILGEFQFNAVHFEQPGVLLHQRVLRLRQDLNQ